MGGTISHVLTILAVDDLATSVSFYRAAFDWSPTVQTPVYAELTVPGGQRLGLYDREGFGRNVGQLPRMVPRGELTSTELYFHTCDLEDAIARMERAGAKMLSPLERRDWGDDAAYFADPSGNVLVLARPSTNP